MIFRARKEGVTWGSAVFNNVSATRVYAKSRRNENTKQGQAATKTQKMKTAVVCQPPLQA